MEEVINYNFTRSNRLLKTQDFNSVLKKPDFRRKQDPFLLLAKVNSKKIARLGLIIPKKRLKKAVHRNALKRMIRETFRNYQHQLVNLDILILLRAPICQWNLEVDNYSKIFVKAINYTINYAKIHEIEALHQNTS